MSGLVWFPVVIFALALWWSPMIVAAKRDVRRLDLVLVLTVLTVVLGVTWLVAWYAALSLPRRRRPAPGHPYAAGYRGPQRGR